MGKWAHVQIPAMPIFIVLQPIQTNVYLAQLRFIDGHELHRGRDNLRNGIYTFPQLFLTVGKTTLIIQRAVTLRHKMPA
jgi:hypothetical protein